MRVLALLLLCLFCQDKGWDQRRDALAKQIEEMRGVAFRAPIQVREARAKEMGDAVVESTRAVLGDYDFAERAFRKLGLVGSLLSLKTSLTYFVGLAGKVFYANGRVGVLDTGIDDPTLLSQLALGLLDQTYPEKEILKRVPMTFDAQVAALSLRWGDAEMVKQMYYYKKKGDEPFDEGTLKYKIEEAEKYEKEGSKLLSRVAPRVLLRLNDFPARRGGIFAMTLKQKGKLQALNQAWSRLPQSTEQILHPEKYLAEEAPVELQTRPLEQLLANKGFVPVFRTVFGELGVLIFLETHLTDDATTAAAGWGGDVLLYYEKGGKESVVVWVTDWDTEQDAKEFRELAAKVSLSDARILAHKTCVVYTVGVPADWETDLVAALKQCRRKVTRTSAYWDDER